MKFSSIRGEVRYDEPMSKHSSWRAGGCADVFVKPADLADLQQLLRSLDPDEPLLWLGLGSNMLVRDGGFRGTVIAMQGVTTELEMAGKLTIKVGAGIPGARLARFATAKGLTGAEFFAGIPGLVGGALAMNAGAWGGETWKHVISVDTIDRQGELHTRKKSDYRIGYRSVEGPEGEWFVSAKLRFKRSEGDDDVVDIRSLLERRAMTQPTGTANCGSVFRNPEGDHAARLIEDCGLKGKRIGGAVVSEKHANFIINDRAASADDIEKLIKLVQREVNEKHEVMLRTEVKIVGEPADETSHEVDA